ncbi:MAG: Type I Iterative PKS [Chrysothrix sp. TS-e1954]|nr:MAG: Type I Iterative PKS [Chrysothrix sp. TS-e1954]
MSSSSEHSAPIAIVGFAYRAPEVGRKGLWEFLAQAKSAWSRVPVDRFNQDGFYHPDAAKPGFFSSKGGHFLPDDIYAFDAPFFNLKADEARAMDPQHRLMLECALEAAESAGITLNDLAGSKTGVFAGNDPSDYQMHMLEDLPTSNRYSATGTAACMFANRLSYFFDLTGPSISLDGACASSSYALHLACQNLRSGECDSAFVGAAKAIVSPNTWSTLDTMGAISPEGRCFSYDVKASGFGRGEGAVSLIIKRLPDAIASGDPIRAVIRNSACGHCGRTQGITMPSRIAQEEILRRVHEEIDLDPNETPFVEGHGTGTQAGDPIEASAFAAVMARFGGSNSAVLLEEAPSESRKRSQTNTINGVVANEHEQACNGCSDTSKRITNGIGSNAQSDGDRVAISVKADPSRGPQLFTFSAKSSASLKSYLSSFANYLLHVPASDELIKAVSFTLGQCRTHFDHRAAAVADTFESLKDQLPSMPPAIRSKESKDLVIAFAFTGQGAQYAQMAAGLRRFEPFATATLDAEDILGSLGAAWSLSDELDKQERETRIHDVEISQPACTAVQVALVILLRAWGITPQVVTGHSSGEIAAAFAAGFISFRAAIAIAYFRGVAGAKIMRDDTIIGAMLAIGTNAQEATTLFPPEKSGYATVAAINSHENVTVSGDVSAIEFITQAAEARGFFVRRLKVGVAYHSRHMERIAASYLTSIQPFFEDDWQASSRRPCTTTFISSVSGSRADVRSVNASYWIKNLLRPVRYMDAIKCLVTTDENDTIETYGTTKRPDVIVEIGPHPTLQTSTKHLLATFCEQTPITCLPSLRRNTPAQATLLRLAATLFTRGLDLRMAEINQTDRSKDKVLTDLPPYEWNKAKLVHMPHIAAQKLNHGQPYESLLGWRSPYSEGNVHTFRNVFTLDDMPWMRDHRMAGDILFPFTGFYALAVAALRTIAPNVSPSVDVREFHIKKSLKIEEEQSIDITTRLRPAEMGTELFSSSIWTFEIMTWSEGPRWTLHCYGMIEADFREMNINTPTIQAAVDVLVSTKLEELDAQHEYASAMSDMNGVYYGPAFQSMVRLRHTPGVVVHDLKLRSLAPHSSSDMSPVTVDAPTLDAFFHAHGVLQGVKGARPLIVPTYCQRFRISNHIPSVANQTFTIVSRRLDRDEKSGDMRMSIAVFATSQDCNVPRIPVAEVEVMTLKCIARPRVEEPGFGLPNCHFLTLKPYIDLVDGQRLERMLAQDSVDEQELQHRRDLNTAGVHFLACALDETAGEDLTHLPLHISKFLEWARDTVSSEYVRLPEQLKLVESVSHYNATGEMLCAVGRKLPAILRGQVEALEIMLKDGLLSRHYEQETNTKRVVKALAGYARNLAEIDPNLSVLEIGAGTGSATAPIIEALTSAYSEATISLRYTFTDISAGFFDNARSKLARWSQHLRYEKLDIGQDPSTQGFVPESYDVIVAANALHATPDIVATMNHVGSLLKPNGKLLLSEATSYRHGAHALPFTLLPGWWFAKDKYRSGEGPLLDRSAWHDLLASSGFSGVQGAIEDYHDQPEHFMTAMWSTKIDRRDCAGRSKPIVVCGSFVGSDEKHFAQQISERVNSRLDCASPIQHISELDGTLDSFYIFIDSSERSFLSDVSLDGFEALKRMVLESQGLLWITPENASPEAETIKGMLRALRQEHSSKQLMLLDNAPSTIEATSAIVSLAERLQKSDHVMIKEQEFTWGDGLVHVPRLMPLMTAKETLAEEAGIPQRETQSLWHSSDGLEMTVDTIGSPESIYFQRNSILAGELKDDEILVRVEAAGMNFRDLLLVLGTMPWHPPGLEGAGTILRAGNQVKDLQPGDRVFYASLQAGFANYVRLPYLHASKLPANVSTVEAATLPIAYSTAITCLAHVARLKEGESVLIHAASGAVGQACIALSQHLGAQIFVTAGTQEKRNFLHNTFAIPWTRIFSSRNSDFRNQILCATDGRGVDVIVNSLSDHLLQMTWDLVADFGRFVEIGKKDALLNNYLWMKPFDRNVTFSSVDIRKIFLEKPQEVRHCLADISDMLQSETITPIRPIHVTPISQVASGLRRLQAGQNIGKIVCTIGPDDMVHAERRPRMDKPSDELLQFDATYLITGGTGGLGRSLASWMFDQGAGNVVLLGRSGATHPDVSRLLKRYEGSKVRLRAIACDVASKDDLCHALSAIQNLPRIRGVIHGALHLRDALLVNSSFEDWKQITAPKIRGAWNLHESLPGLDFFVSLASMTGVIGHAGQSIYSGTTSFLDAFTSYRLKRGLPAASISLPVVEDIGSAADRGLVTKLSLTLAGSVPVAQLYILVKAGIVGPSSGIVNLDGRVIPFMPLPDNAQPGSWSDYGMFAALRRAPDDSADHVIQNGVEMGVDQSSQGRLTSETLVDALSSKIASITMMDREEIQPERALLHYGLDSLVSVELRNWIRRESGIEMALNQIVGAAHIRALADLVLSQK